MVLAPVLVAPFGGAERRFSTAPVAIGVLDPRAPLALVALYNVWLLATVAALVAALITLAFDFFSFITGGNRR